MTQIHDHPGARIDLQPPDEGRAQVEEILSHFGAALGSPPTALRLLGVSPPILGHYAGMVGYYMEHPRLRPPLTTLIRYLAASHSECDYCVDLNEAMLLDMGYSLDAVRAARADVAAAPLGGDERALLEAALQASRDPQWLTSERIAALRAHGWSDRDVFDAVWLAAMNHAFGQVVDAFGVTPDGYTQARTDRADIDEGGARHAGA